MRVRGGGAMATPAVPVVMEEVAVLARGRGSRGGRRGRRGRALIQGPNRRPGPRTIDELVFFFSLSCYLFFGRISLFNNETTISDLRCTTSMICRKTMVWRCLCIHIEGAAGNRKLFEYCLIIQIVSVLFLLFTYLTLRPYLISRSVTATAPPPPTSPVEMEVDGPSVSYVADEAAPSSPRAPSMSPSFSVPSPSL